jgi:type II secretion system protein G
MKKGFTLVELLVVIAIIGILSTLSVVSLNSARAKSRDARRLSDIKQIRTALDMYYDSSSTYPLSCTTTLGTGNCACLTSVGWTNTSTTNCTGTIFMQKVPSDPLSSGTYVYTSSGQSYEIVYKLEANSGNSTATPSSMGN